MVCASVSFITGQTIDVKGIVVDSSDNEPVIGASVLVKGTHIGTSTDLEGQFSFTNLKSTDKLVVTYVGMKTVEVAVAPQLTIKMESVASQLDEVIVTAFGTAKKSSFTGSAAVIGSEKIEQKQVSNVMQTLMGEVAGLDVTPSTAPGEKSSMVIRGKGTINAGTEPLVVVDGMPFEGEISSINPSDVENTRC
ncbi:MAG: carboxypeptidase-like regulatory domain-containing protein [Bacteroidales bacterium]|nr:carboxypeptidase-like regulatory domain-containing protein [Bacteroidales bacterium]